MRSVCDFDPKMRMASHGYSAYEQPPVIWWRRRYCQQNNHFNIRQQCPTRACFFFILFRRYSGLSKITF